MKNKIDVKIERNWKNKRLKETEKRFLGREGLRQRDYKARLGLCGLAASQIKKGT